jgi:DNA-binding GntR family transcriptional regulator
MKNKNTIKIYQDYKKQIISGKLNKGDRLVETSIAKEYNASRLHVKEAFHMLEREHLAEYIRNCGFVVLGVSTEVLAEIALIRQALEQVIIKKVIEVATPENIEHMKRIVSRMKVFANNAMLEDSFSELSRLYRYFYDISKYEHIVNVLNMYNDYIDVIIQMSATKVEDHIEGYTIMENLVEAIEKKDVDWAMKEAVRRHKNLPF